MAEAETAGGSPFDLNAGTPIPDGQLRPKPKFADRISKRVLWSLALFLLVCASVFIAALEAMDAKQEKKQQAEITEPGSDRAAKEVEVGAPSELTKAPEDAAGPSLLRSVSSGEGTDTAAQPASSGLGKPDPSRSGQPASSLGVAGLNSGDTGGGNLGLGGGSSGPVGGEIKQETPEERVKKRIEADRLEKLSQARRQGLSVTPFAGAEGQAAAAGPGAPTASALNALLGAAKDSLGGGGMQQVAAGAGSDVEQQQKLNFIKNAANSDRLYHPHTPQPARSPNEVKKGSFIPMMLTRAINSDLPGQVAARVTEDVYDTVTGCRLLIPANSQAVGEYDSKVAIGQGRNLVVWTSMIFPNGDELNLGGMQGYDSSGAAGLEADVDNHYLRLFGLTFGMSMITAQVQMSAPQQTTGTTGMNSQQAIAMALAQQYGQLGAQIIGKYMAVQPTLRNAVGERFVVMVPATVMFNKVWRRRC